MQYFRLGLAAYTVGLLLTDAALLIMGMAQPALMWINPCLLAAVFFQVCAFCFDLSASPCVVLRAHFPYQLQGIGSRGSTSCARYCYASLSCKLRTVF